MCPHQHHSFSGCVKLIESLDDWRLLAVSAFWLLTLCLAQKSLVFLSQPVRRGRSSLPALSLALMALPFLPAANLLFHVGFVVAERNLYLSILGFNLLVVTGYRGLIRSKRLGGLYTRALKVGLVVLTAAHAAKSYARCREWRDEDTLFRSGPRVCPTNAKVRNIFQSACVLLLPRPGAKGVQFRGQL